MRIKVVGLSLTISSVNVYPGISSGIGAGQWATLTLIVVVSAGLITGVLTMTIIRGKATKQAAWLLSAFNSAVVATALYFLVF